MRLKKLKRAYQEYFGDTVDNMPSPPMRGNKLNKRDLVRHYRNTKPSSRLAYYKALREFMRQIKFEFIYDERKD